MTVSRNARVEVLLAGRRRLASVLIRRNPPDPPHPAPPVPCPGAEASPRTVSNDTVVDAVRQAGPRDSFASLGRRFGISGERVRQLVVAHERRSGEKLPRQLARYRASLPVARPKPTVAQRLLAQARLIGETGCWAWDPPGAAAAPQRAGCFSALGEHYATRVAYVLWRGRIPAGHVVKQTCRNRLCINPWHLEAVTPAEAFGSYPRRARTRAPATHCKRGHPFTEENTLLNTCVVVRHGLRVRQQTRLCRICRKAYLKTRPKEPACPTPPLPQEETERMVERAIRKAVRARRGSRIARLSDELDFWAAHWRKLRNGAARPRQRESYDAYWERAGSQRSWERWFLSRICADPRILKELRRPDADLHPLLQAELAWHDRREAARRMR